MINKKSKIYVAGHKGLVGSAILRKLRFEKYSNLLFRTKKQLDLTNQLDTYNFLKKNRPDAVIIAAAKVGGINANNTLKAEFIYENLAIQNNLIHGSYKAGVKNLIFLGSSCVYPKKCKQPIKENYLLSGYLEKTNEPYAIAKIAAIKLCESLNLDLHSKGISVTAICPGFIDTPLTQKNSHEMPFLISSEKAAKLISVAIEKRKALYIFPWQMNLLMSFAEKVPRWFYRGLIKVLLPILMPRRNK